MSALPTQHIRLRLDRLAELSDAERAIVSQRKALVDSWRNMTTSFLRAGHTKAEATAAYLHAHPGLSRATLYRWNSFRDSDDPTDLLDRRSKSVRTRIETTRADACSADAWRRFKTLWLNPTARSVALCWQIVKAEAVEHDWTWPSLRSVQRKCQRELPPIQADSFRLSDREWHRLYAPKMSRNYDDYRSGEFWVGDFHEVDVFCRRSDSDPAIVRPLISTFMDLRSRVIVAAYVCLHENQDTVLLAFRRGAERWGLPTHVIIDNGKPYRARGVSGGRPSTQRTIADEDYVRSVFGGLEVAVHFSIPFNPDSKPVERFFLTLEMQFGATFASYCGGDNHLDRFKLAHKLAKQQPEACPTVAEYAEQLDRWCESYHATPHRGEGMNGLSPAQAFKQCNPIAKRMCPDGALDLLLMRTEPVKVTSAGVLFRGDHYGQGLRELQLLIGKQVLLRVDPVDAGHVIVCDLEGKPIVRAYNNRRLYSGVTQDDIGAAMRRRKRARQLAREVMDGGLRPTLETVTDAAIAARLQAGQAAAAALKDGTTDTPVRNVQPLRSDFTEAMQQYNRRVSPTPPPPDRGPSLEDAMAAMESMKKQTGERRPARPAIDIADLKL
jgi:transposase InsO family protein